MTSRERLLTALNHREPDRVPFDMGSTQVSGISVLAYQRLRQHLRLPYLEPTVCDTIQQLALPDDDIVERLGIDVRGLFPLNAHNWNIINVDAGDNWQYTDEWGITYHFPKHDGLYYTIVANPIPASSTTPEEIAHHPWPDCGDLRRIEGLRQMAERYRAQGRAVMLKGVLAGIFEMAQRMRGTENFMVDLLADRVSAEALLDRMVQCKLGFWEMALPRLGDVVDVVSEADDYGTQVSQLVSPRLFRELMKPRLKIVFERIHQLAPQAKLFFHSCGSIREILPDFIEIGVDIINPVHVRAAGMEPAALKRDFGRDVVFWGGGVDTQGVLPSGTPEQVREDVRHNLEALMPGGGYVFNTIHNIQADVPPENIIAMWETLREVGMYR
ncbi:MAG: uroporphyrinogen decarboxylase family protein [Anaerolineae bacterium]